jgi:predicted Zn-dependent protease
MRASDPILPLGLLTREACLALAAQVFRLLSGESATLRCSSFSRGATEVARGMTEMVSESRRQTLSLAINTPRGCTAWATTTRLDEAGVEQLVGEARAAARQLRTPDGRERLSGPRRYPTPPEQCFDSALVPMSPEGRSPVIAAAQDAVQRAGLIGAADLSVEFDTFAVINSAGLSAYRAGSYVECSLTARTKDGKGSGWARSGFEDWRRVETEAVIHRAVDLAQRAAKPVAVEPGRYTVILEPAAVADLVQPMFQWAARLADRGYTPYAREPRGNNKLGLQMLDSRLHLVADPWDPDKPTPVFDYNGIPIPSKVTWFEHGVLRNLEYDLGYAREKGKLPVSDPTGGRLYGEGPTTSLDDMIKSVRRGLWVNRLSNATLMNGRTGLATGTTRDGTFLIENGRITKAVKNLRFTESPFFVLNKLEAFGEPVRASRTIVAPRLLVRDFDFTSLTDAV